MWKVSSPALHIVLISVRGWVDLWVIVQPEGISQWNIPKKTHRESNPRPSGCSTVPKPTAPPRFPRNRCISRTKYVTILQPCFDTDIREVVWKYKTKAYCEIRDADTVTCCHTVAQNSGQSLQPSRSKRRVVKKTLTSVIKAASLVHPSLFFAGNITVYLKIKCLV